MGKIREALKYALAYPKLYFTNKPELSRLKGRYVFPVHVIDCEVNRKVLTDMISEIDSTITQDSTYHFGTYPGSIDTGGHYGRIRNVTFLKLHFTTEEDNVAFLLRYPDKLAVANELIKRGGSTT